MKLHIGFVMNDKQYTANWRPFYLNGFDSKMHETNPNETTKTETKTKYK